MPTPPRRRRPDPPARRTGSGNHWLPTAAMGLGVIVAGLGIGALVAVLMQRNPSRSVAVATVTSAPAVVASSRPPLTIATFEPPRTPRPSPSPAPISQPSNGRPATSASNVTPPPATLAPVVGTPAAVDATSAPEPDTTTTAPTVAPRPIVAAPAPRASEPVVSAAPSPAIAAPTGSPTASGPVATDVAASANGPGYEQHASAVVRRYLDAVIHGDQTTAYNALAATPATAPGALTEQAFLDPGARIVSLKVTRIDASNASVGCEISSAKGRYYATYHVTAASSGPYISEHDYIKV